MVTCSECGAATNPEDEYCSSCGARVSEQSVISGSSLKEHLQSMDDYEFEHFVADLWERQGWDTEVSQASVDAGIDVIAEKEELVHQKLVIQAKRFGRNSSVGGPDVQQYSSLRNQVDGADSVAIVTTGRITSAAEKRAQELNVKLIDGDDLVRIVEEFDAYDVVEEYTDIQPTTDSTKKPIDLDTESPEIDYEEVTREFGEWAAAEIQRKSHRLMKWVQNADERVPERQTYGEEIPQTKWILIVYVMLVGWVSVFFFASLDPQPGSTLDQLYSIVLLTSWPVLITAIYFDCFTVARYSDWRPNPVKFAFGAAIPFVSIAVGGYYVYHRTQFSEQAREESASNENVSEFNFDIEPGKIEK